MVDLGAKSGQVFPQGVLSEGFVALDHEYALGRRSLRAEQIDTVQLGGE